MAGKEIYKFIKDSWKNVIISSLLSAPITAAVYFWFLQPSNFISKRYIAAAILLWIVLAAGIFYLLRRIKLIMASIDQQVYVIAMLLCIITAFLLGYFVIGIENTPYNLFTLPKHSVVIENASENDNDVIELIYFNSGFREESLSKLIMDGSWKRTENSLIVQGTQKASLSYEGWLVGNPALSFQAQPDGGRVNVYWDGKLEQVSLSSPKPYQRHVTNTNTIEIPIFNKIAVLIVGSLSIAIALLALILLLAKIVNMIPRSFIMPADISVREKIMRKTIASILTVAACIMFVGLIILLLSTKETPPLDVVSIKNIFTLPVNLFKPEPGEHWIFVCSTLALPFLCIGFYLLFTSLISMLKGNMKIIHLLLSIITTVCLILLTVAGLLKKKLFLAASSIVQKPYLTLAFCTVTLIAFMISSKFFSHKKQSVNRLLDFIYFLAGILMTVILVMETTFNEREPLISGIHFIAYFDSVVQVYLGKTLLVNDTAQYGLYALLLKPIFQLIGLSVFKFSLLMSILKGLAFISLLFLLRFATKNRWVAFTGFATIVFYTRFRVPLDVTSDPYFQYSPHRLFFPVVFILLLWIFLCEKKINRKKALYLFISLFCALSVLWNPDSGFVVLITWLICLVYTEMLLIKNHNIKKILINCIKHFVVISASIIITFICFNLYTFFYSGMWPEMSSLLAYPNLFSKYGFNMLPITQIIHPWNMFVIIYTVGVFMGVRNFLEYAQIIDPPPIRREGEKEANTLILAISIMGIGLFYYYIGRSHDLNLINLSWPVLLLSAIFADKIFSDLSKNINVQSLKIDTNTHPYFPQMYYKVILFVTLFCFLTSSILSIAVNFPLYRDLISTRISGILDGIPNTLHDEIEFIKSNSDRGNQILILSNLAPELYLYTNTPRPLPVPGFGELVLRSDTEKIFSFLRVPPMNAKIFWDPTFTMFDPTQFPNYLTLSASSDGLLLFSKK